MMQVALNSLTIDELEQVVGGAYPSEEIDPETGEVVLRDCTGREIGRQQSL